MRVIGLAGCCLLLAACLESGANACVSTSCLEVEGRYQLVLGVGSADPNCAQQGVVWSNDAFLLARNGASLTTVLFNVPLRGTLLTDGTFTLRDDGLGDGGVTRLSTRAQFREPGVLTGNLDGNYESPSAAGSSVCVLNYPYQANRVD